MYCKFDNHFIAVSAKQCVWFVAFGPRSCVTFKITEPLNQPHERIKLKLHAGERVRSFFHYHSPTPDAGSLALSLSLEKKLSVIS